MNKKLYFLLLICFFIFGCREINKDPLSHRLSRSQAERDLGVFTDILKKEHPSLYTYISPGRLNSMIENIRSSVLDGVTLQDFYNKLTLVVNEIGCSHTDIDFPGYIYDTLNGRKCFFPYPVLWIEHKLIVNAVGYDLPEGTEIEKINGEPAKGIMESLAGYNPVEGHHRNVQKELAADRFAIEYFFKYGRQDVFVLNVKDTTGSEHVEKEDAITFKESGRRYNNDRYYYDRTDVDYNFHVLDKGHCGYMMIRTFSFDGQTKQGAYEDFCANTFELLSHKKDIKNLIIDLRENTGGSLYNAFLLYSYFARHPFKEFEMAMSKIDQVAFRQYLDKSYEDISADTVNTTLKKSFTDHHDPDYYLMADSLIETWKPDKFRFDGNLYVIINDKVMSAASYFGTLVKNSGVGKIVGDETTGGSCSGNGYSALYYSLPESGIRLFFPYVHLLYSFRDKKNTGMGLKADYVIPDTYESFKNNSDRQVSFIRDSLILN